MRISDWSSDVCSSDLTAPETVIIPRLNSIPDLNPSPEISESDRTDRLNVREIETPVAAPVTETTEKAEEQPPLEAGKSIFNYPRSDTTSPRSIPSVPVGGELQSTSAGDRKSVGQGTRVSVRVDLGCRRNMKKKKKKKDAVSY